MACDSALSKCPQNVLLLPHATGVTSSTLGELLLTGVPRSVRGAFTCPLETRRNLVCPCYGVGLYVTGIRRFGQMQYVHERSAGCLRTTGALRCTTTWGAVRGVCSTADRELHVGIVNVVRCEPVMRCQGFLCKTGDAIPTSVVRRKFVWVLRTVERASV